MWEYFWQLESYTDIKVYHSKAAHLQSAKAFWLEPKKRLFQLKKSNLKVKTI